MAFRMKGAVKPTDVDFELKQDGPDVNIFANDVFVGYFDGERGNLVLMQKDPSDRSRVAGLKFDANGRLAIAE